MKNRKTTMAKIKNHNEGKLILKDVEIEKEYEDLFEFSNEEEEDQHEARMIMYRFLSEIERVSGPEKGLKNKLANLVGKSRSYITQLFNGDKLINLVMLAKFQRALSIKFKIVAYPEESFKDYTSTTKSSVNYSLLIDSQSHLISEKQWQDINNIILEQSTAGATNSSNISSISAQLDYEGSKANLI
jgi:transcriptional regulator with XRE-family HTH domain